MTQKTFPIEYEYAEYHRVLKKIIKSVPNKKSVTIIPKETYKTNDSDRNKYIQYKSYNKSKQLKIQVEKDLMRFEIKIKGKEKIQKEFGDVSFFNLSQHEISEVFQRLINKIINRMEREKEQRKKELLKLMKSLKQSDAHWIKSTLLQISNRENKDDCPWFLDINEILEVVDKLELTHKKRTKDTFKSNAERHLSVMCQNDGIKLKEILSKIAT